MKKIIMFGVLFALVGLQSCKKEQKQETTDDSQAQSEIPANANCYEAVYEKDTLNLSTITEKDGKISGRLVMNVSGEPLRDGKIEGKFKGDTLFCAYTFTLASQKEVTHKNPMAFLKKGNELILGNGEIEMYLGASYFKKGKPIDFEKVKYHFTATDCGGE